jgi:peptidoglycan/LPS O-acetylase OafA/YrhL
LEVKQDSYVKSLDGLRFLAVLLVLLDHWTNYRLGFPGSYLGVSLFFVLSGYLITNILLKAKLADENNNRSHLKSIKLFFIRRTIRIFPVYYLVLFLLLLFNVGAIKEHFIWLFTYQTNNFIAYKGAWIGIYDHFWSLAVEEQFYLFFPFVIFFVKWKQLPKIIFGLILLSIGLRFWLYSNQHSWVVPFVLMPTSLDALGLGSLLAYFLFNNSPNLPLKANTLKTNLLISFLAYALMIYLVQSTQNEHNIYATVWLRLFEAIFSVCLIFSFVAINDSSYFTSIKQLLFENSVVVYIGKISYGIYIYHHFVYNFYYTNENDILSRIFRKLNNFSDGLGDNMLIKLAIVFPIVLIIATISWYIFEKPINKLKEKYDY